MAAVPRRLGLFRRIPIPNGIPDGFYERLDQQLGSRRPEAVIRADYPHPNGTMRREFPYDITTQDGSILLGSIMNNQSYLSIRIQGDNENLLADVTSAVEAALAQEGGRRSRKGNRTRARKSNRGYIRKGSKKYKTRGRK